MLLCTQTLRDVLKSYESLVNYNKTNDNHESREELDEIDEDLLDEVHDKSASKIKDYISMNIFYFLGITFFLHRLRGILDEMFALDVRHYASTLLYPKYRSLKACSATERAECYRYVRQQAELIYIESNESDQRATEEPKAKKFKGDLFRRFESDGPDAQQESGGESGNESEEYMHLHQKSWMNLIVI